MVGCVVHGDYCLPNIILKEHTVSGYIDVALAGVGDRYQDLALAVRSLAYNNKADPVCPQRGKSKHHLPGLHWRRINIQASRARYILVSKVSRSPLGANDTK